ncbi:MAG TPA: flagellar export chaperone FlgN [Gemmata sp.]
MQTLQPPSARTETFLQHLGVEEQLLTQARDKALEVYAALRGGDLKGVTALGAQQEELAAALRAASAARLGVTNDLASDLNISPDRLTLLQLTEALPEPEREAVRAARARLSACAAEFTRIQTRNANLLGHLRSFIRDVLADITPDSTPQRYGPTGGWLSPAPGAPLLRRGT